MPLVFAPILFAARGFLVLFARIIPYPVCRVWLLGALCPYPACRLWLLGVLCPYPVCRVWFSGARCPYPICPGGRAGRRAGGREQRRLRHRDPTSGVSLRVDSGDHTAIKHFVTVGIVIVAGRQRRRFYLRYRGAPLFLRDDVRNWENPKRYRWGCHLKASRKTTTPRDYTDFSFFHQQTK